MKSISTKLFFALLSLTTLVLVATLLLARWSFDQGFLDYLNAQQELRLTNMATDLSEHYSSNGDKWSDETPKAYRQIYRKWFPGPRNRPPPLGGRPKSRLADFDENRTANNDVDAELRGQGRPTRRERFERNRPPHEKKMAEPFVLLSSQNELIAGHQGLLLGQELLSVDILSGQEVVGKVQTIKKIKLNNYGESTFSKQQTNASWLIAVVSLLIAGVASWALSRMLLAPTFKMKNRIASLVQGDFSNRMTIMSDDELGQLMGDINRLSETLEENRTSRRRWLADISHELRTPVAILSGELEAVLDGIRPLNNQAIESLNHEVIRLKHLIDDLYQLSLSDIGGLRYQFIPTDVGELLTLVIAKQAQRLDAAGMALKVGVQKGVVIDADAVRLEQLFINLINNSKAYTDAPGTIEIDLKRQSNDVVIRFSDSAPGLKTESCEEIFEPLFREDESRNRRVAGAGLGLAISKNIVNGHQGSISVKPSSLGGLEFTIKLPVNRKN